MTNDRQEFLKTTSILMIAGGIIAGAKGFKACKVPENARKDVIWGILSAVLSIVSTVIGLIGGGEFSITSLVLNMLVPGLYVCGALKTKPNVNA